MKNKKALILVLAVIAIAVFVLSGCSKQPEKAAEEAKQTVEQAAEKAEEGAAAAGEAVEQAAGEVKETVKEAAEKAEEGAAAAGEAVEQAAEEVKETVEEAAEKAEEAAAAAEETVEAAKEQAAEAVEAVTEKAEEVAEKVEEAATAAEETVEAAKEQAAEAAEAVTEKAEEAAAAAGEAVAEAAEEVAQAAENATETAKVMSHAEFVQAELDTPVCVETYVQASQGWWAKDGVGRKTLYLQSEDGAYFAYEVLMDEAEAQKMVPGTKLRLEGIKAEWSGEVEIIEAKYEILEGSYIAEPADITELLGKDELADHINEKIAIKGAKVAASKVEGQDGEFAFLYNWDGSGSHDGNSDLYFNVEVGGQTYTLTVESYLCGNDTDVYAAVEGLKIGDTIDCEGFLYWYNGANPHITSVTVK